MRLGCQQTQMLSRAPTLSLHSGGNRGGPGRIVRWAVTICEYASGLDPGRAGGGTGV